MTALSALHLLQTRRTVPSAYLGDPGPSTAEIEAMVTMAMRVPDHGKLAPWRYIAMDRPTREALRVKLTAIGLAAMPSSDPRALDKQLNAFTKAPLCLAVVSSAATHPKIPVWEQHLSVGASTMNLIHGAHALGYSAQWLTGWAAYDQKAKALFGVTEDEDIAGFVHIGTPTAPPVERDRPDVSAHLSYVSA